MSLAVIRVAGFVILGLAFSVTAGAADEFQRLTCKMGECVWYRIDNRLDIKLTESGKLVGATTAECTTQTKAEEEYPKTYRCRETDTRQQDYVANCSLAIPAISFKDNQGKWQRTKLSISEDAEFGYNRSSIDLYLRICHDFVRGSESLDMLGARYGYRSRAKEIQRSEQDAVAAIADLVTEKQVESTISSEAEGTSAKLEGFQTPSRNIFCQVLTFDSDEPSSLRCDVINIEGPFPTKPRNCRDTDWGQAFAVSAGGKGGQRICYTDSVISESLPVLSYGLTFKTKDFVCKSETIGVTCLNSRDHGFFVSKRKQLLF
jgi:hypothetical protein